MCIYEGGKKRERVDVGVRERGSVRARKRVYSQRSLISVSVSLLLCGSQLPPPTGLPFPITADLAYILKKLRRFLSDRLDF